MTQALLQPTPLALDGAAALPDVTEIEALTRRYVAMQLRRFRRDMQLTQHQAAIKANIGYSSWRTYEDGARLAPLDTLVKMALALETDPHFFIPTATWFLRGLLPDSPQEGERDEETLDG